MQKFTVSYPLLIAAALALAFDKSGWIILYLAAAALHECGHLAAILLCDGRVQHITATLCGLKIDYTSRRQTSYAADALMALAGPLANLAVMLAAAAASRFFPDENLFYFCGVNLILALFNLIPAAPLDGGRALKAALMALWGADRGERAAQTVSLAAGWLLAAAGLILLFFTRRNASLLFTALLVLQNAHCPSARRSKQGNMRNKPCF